MRCCDLPAAGERCTRVAVVPAGCRPSLSPLPARVSLQKSARSQSCLSFLVSCPKKEEHQKFFLFQRRDPVYN